ncbi:MAG: LysR substrate-binding domain-containing protein [Mycobacteriaceae bacterium]
MTEQTYQPTLAQLRAFVAIAEYRHFGSAATSLGITQPTLSQALSALEAGLRVQLVERSTRRVLVTAAGENLLSNAMATLEAADGFVSAAAGVASGLSGPLRMGLIPTVAPYLLPSLLPTLKTSLPTLRPRVIEDQTARLLESLRAGSLDVAVLALPSDSASNIEIPLYTEDFVLLLPSEHPLSGQINLSVELLAELPLLLLDEGHCLRDQTLDLCRSADVVPIATETRATSLSTVVQCVAGGLGVTLLPESALPVEVGRSGLTMARFASPAPGRTMGLVYRASSTRAEDYLSLAAVIKQAVPKEMLCSD